MLRIYRKLRSTIGSQSIALTIVLIGLTFPLKIYAGDIFFIHPSKCSQNTQLLNEKLNQAYIDIASNGIKHITLDEATTSLKSNDIAIALGPLVFTSILDQKLTNPIVAVFISRDDYYRIIRSREQPVTAIFNDSDPIKQVALAKAIYGSDSSLAAFSTKESEYFINDIKEFASIFNIPMSLIHETREVTIKQVLKKIKNSKFILLHKDSLLYQRFSLEKLLYLSFDLNNQGVIGYNKNVVKIGGLASIDSTIGDIAKSLNSIITIIKSSSSMPPADYPIYFSISLNKYILRSLKLSSATKSELHSAVQNMYRRFKSVRNGNNRK